MSKSAQVTMTEERKRSEQGGFAQQEAGQKEGASLQPSDSAWRETSHDGEWQYNRGKTLSPALRSLRNQKVTSLLTGQGSYRTERGTRERDCLAIAKGS